MLKDIRNNKNYISILEEIKNTLARMSYEKTDKLTRLISNSKRVFITGAGRTGLMMKAFAIRLMQMGIKVYVVGETTTPAIKADDMLFIGSGSGETESLVVIAGKAKKIGAKLALVSMSADSTLGEIVDIVVEIPAKGSKSDANSSPDSPQVMCNLFEQSLLIYLDVLSMSLMEYKKIDKKTLYENHANLE